MLFLFQGCLRLSFKIWTGFQDSRIYRIDCFKLNRALTMDRMGVRRLEKRKMFSKEKGNKFEGFIEIMA